MQSVMREQKNVPFGTKVRQFHFWKLNFPRFKILPSQRERKSGTRLNVPNVHWKEKVSNLFNDFSPDVYSSLNFELHSCAYQLRNTVSESIKVFIHNNEKGGCCRCCCCWREVKGWATFFVASVGIFIMLHASLSSIAALKAFGSNPK